MKAPVSMGGKLSRRVFLAGGLSTALAASRVANTSSGHNKTRGRVIILGFDGVEPSIVESMLNEGRLPSLSRLASMGAWSRLKTTAPPQSPVAWSSFATGVNPGAHNIFDFIRRNPRGANSAPTPVVGTGSFSHATFNADGSISHTPSAESFLKGQTFWAAADAQGLHTKVLNVPYMYPPEPLHNSFMLSGLGTPDLRGVTSFYMALSDQFTPQELQTRISGGQRLLLEFDRNDETSIPITGPRDTRKPFGSPDAFTTIKAILKVDRIARIGAIILNGRKAELCEGQWSDWIELEFAVSSSYTVYGLVRWFPTELGSRVRLYMSCRQFHPAKPYAPFTSPANWSDQLSQRYGMFKTIGWAYDTHALDQGDLPDEAFIEDMHRTMAWRERLTLDEVDQDNFSLLVSVWTATDRAAHMYWRFRDTGHPAYSEEGARLYGAVIEDIYARMDTITGNIMRRLKPEDTLIVMSDHGFGTWRTGFQLNTWLRDHGYLALADPNIHDKGWLQNINWTRTRAYALGLSSLYLNLKTREGRGTVTPEERLSLLATLRKQLLDETDPATGHAIFASVNLGEDLYKGPFINEAPDLVLGYAPGYQSTKSSAGGSADGPLLSPNNESWSGEHAASDAGSCPGVFFCNRAWGSGQPAITDIAPTVLACLEAEPLPGVEGSNLLGRV